MDFVSAIVRHAPQPGVMTVATIDHASGRVAPTCSDADLGAHKMTDGPAPMGLVTASLKRHHLASGRSRPCATHPRKPAATRPRINSAGPTPAAMKAAPKDPMVS